MVEYKDKLYTLFQCEPCKYTTQRKSDYEKHLQTKKHNTNMKGNTNTNINMNTNTKSIHKKRLTCACGKTYTYEASFEKHKLKCNIHPQKSTSKKITMTKRTIHNSLGSGSNSNSNSNPNSTCGFPENFNDIFKNMVFDTVTNTNQITIFNNEECKQEELIHEDNTYTNTRANIKDIEQIHIHPECNMFSMICTIPNLDIPLSVYEYSMDDPDIKELYTTFTNMIQKFFTVEHKKIIVDASNMTHDEIDKHNLCVVNNLLFITQEQQRILHKTVVHPQMFLQSDEVKMKYYKDVVKLIVFLYGDEIQELTEMLIDSLQMHQGGENNNGGHDGHDSNGGHDGGAGDSDDLCDDDGDGDD